MISDFWHSDPMQVQTTWQAFCVLRRAGRIQLCWGRLAATRAGKAGWFHRGTSRRAGPRIVGDRMLADPWDFVVAYRDFGVHLSWNGQRILAGELPELLETGSLSRLVD